MPLLLQNRFILVKPLLCRRIIYSLGFVHLWQLRIDVKLLIKFAQVLFLVKSVTPLTQKPAGIKTDMFTDPTWTHLTSQITIDLLLVHSSFFLHAKKAMVYYP